jgi:hypothetical protein
MPFTFQRATERDDPDLRWLLATNPMPGRLTIAFEREPNYFVGCGTMGHFWQVLIGRHRPSGEITAVLCRASSPRFINGQVREIGYLGQLRVADKYRGRWVLLHGLPALRELHADGRVAVYLSAISDENEIARGILVDHPRPYFPAMREVAHLYTSGIILRRRRALLPSRRGRSTSLEIDRGSECELGEIVAFLRQHGAARQFFPAYAEADFGDSPTTRGFHVRDFVVARRKGQIVGTVGLWDQSTYKQSVVRSYHDYLRWIRPLYNLGARLVGAQPLPAPGQQIRSAYASFICIADDDPHVFRALLRQAYDLAAGRGYAYLMVGLAERDPLLPVAQERPHIAYHSTLYTACWEDATDFHEQLDDRVPYIEIAAL